MAHPLPQEVTLRDHVDGSEKSGVQQDQHKVLSTVVDYSLDFDLLQFNYDR